MNEFPIEVEEALLHINNDVMKFTNGELITYLGEDINKYIGNYALFLENFQDEINKIVREHLTKALHKDT